ncbi:FAD-dependent monooxygenase [Streptosporangium lutulentum]
MGDAVNLGWKLAATVRGWAPEGLLDTYTTERHPIGAWVLDWTRAQIVLMRPDPRSRALREVVTELTETVTGTTYFAKQISGVWQRYDLHGDHPLVGAARRTSNWPTGPGSPTTCTRAGRCCWTRREDYGLW